MDVKGEAVNHKILLKELTVVRGIYGARNKGIYQYCNSIFEFVPYLKTVSMKLITSFMVLGQKPPFRLSRQYNLKEIWLIKRKGRKSREFVGLYDEKYITEQ